MHKLTIVAATIAIGALLAPAQAETSAGGPIKNGNQCYKGSPGEGRDIRFGLWESCPQAASVAPARRAVRRSATR